MEIKALQKLKAKSIIVENGFNFILSQILFISVLVGGLLGSWMLFGVLLVGLLYVYHKENLFILKIAFSLAWAAGFYYLFSQFEQGIIECSIAAIIGFIGSWLVHTIGFTSFD
ncbi:hypothetical protein [Chengkuizengella axinellae]|uniref:Uncharacterized protein n=1 Tax=Chengkuizengella axinellae TaxID=3064388 RepID=A0ABT9IX45_9BACL|nr:hypothetical protein [Chengkuizengella sp. 2205SS18-9]MDP5273940.1 hypothetical protein [Chengkuizengella sp. 2205SS18-9]